MQNKNIRTTRLDTEHDRLDGEEETLFGTPQGTLSISILVDQANLEETYIEQQVSTKRNHEDMKLTSNHTTTMAATLVVAKRRRTRRLVLR